MKREYPGGEHESANDDGQRGKRAVGVKKEEPGVAALQSPRVRCPYLDTINYTVLDFDLPKQCSVTLRKENVYVCLVCGGYFQGRGKTTPAYLHSMQASHHVFLNLRNERFYCLPDNYEVVDAALGEITRAVNPHFSSADIAKLDERTALRRDKLGAAFFPGFVGLNNLTGTDYVNVVVQLLARVKPLRDHLLSTPAMSGVRCPVSRALGEVVRKIWSPHNFKNCVGPHELVSAIVVESKKRFQVGHRSEAAELLAWLLTTLHRGLGGKHKRGSSVVHHAFQGEVEVTSQPIAPDGATQGDGANPARTVKRVPFLFLSVELPPAPMFPDDAAAKKVIPEIPLMTVLEKYDGSTPTDDVATGTRRWYRITKLPRYLVLHLRRFKRNEFFVEKNPTIVKFPLRNLEMAPYVATDALPTAPDPLPPSAPARDLKALCRRAGVSTAGVVEAEELRTLAGKAQRVLEGQAGTKYDLLTNVCHDMPPETRRDAKTNPVAQGHYRCHVLSQAADQWFEAQDLHVEEVMPELIPVSETSILCYERQDLRAASVRARQRAAAAAAAEAATEAEAGAEDGAGAGASGMDEEA